jgi:glycosyltransferase involved in cell wall biosynthesis
LADREKRLETVNVLFLTQTSELGPSSRYRVYQLLPALQQLGIEGVVSPAIDEALYRRLYLDQGGSHSRVSALSATWGKRRADLQQLKQVDAVLIQKGVFPGLYSGFERRIAAQKPLVFDFDDAIWLPRVGGSRLLRALHRERAVQDILRRASAVIAGNDFLAEYARRFNGSVRVVPSSINVGVYRRAANSNSVGWIGSRTTLSYLKPLAPVFKQLGIKPRVIASGDPRQLDFDVEYRPWQLETEMEELAQIGIGIAPLPDTDWERGKCGVKILQYMACGIPVVASPVGVQQRFVQHGVTGFFARNDAEWTQHLRELIENPELRRKMGAAAREVVAREYDVAQAAQKVASVLQSVVPS